MKFECRYEECESKCCRNLKANKMLINYDLDSKRYVHFLEVPNKVGIALFREEKNSLLKFAKELGIRLKISPLRGFLGKDKKICVFKWFMDHDECPFLLNNSCRIYNNRPLVCRSFPYLPPFSYEPVPEHPVMSEYCPCSDKKEIYHDLMNEYNKSIERQKLLMKTIEDLVSKGFVVKEKTSTVMRLSKDSRLLIEFD
ncbi:MAG: YkgJ family cysteine cluster protein [Candidatus Nanoarchaeia archaeon]|jgi:Fe-S-cluster containining protein